MHGCLTQRAQRTHIATSSNEHGCITQRCAKDEHGCFTQRSAKDEHYLSYAKRRRGQTLQVICNPVYAVFFSLSYFFHDKKVTKNLVLSKAFLGSKPKLKNRLFARNPKPEAASVILVHYSSPIFLNYHTTIASRCCFHTLVLRTLGCGACGAIF